MKYAKPLNLYWQTSAIFQTSYNLGFERESGDSDVMQASSDARVLETNLGGTIQYLPNSRSSFRFSITGSYQHSDSDHSIDITEPESFHLSVNQLSLRQEFDIYYYISPKLRLELISFITLRNASDKTTYENALTENESLGRYNSNNLTVKLIYSFF